MPLPTFRHPPAIPCLQLYSPPGSSCGTVNPDDTEQCCKDKIEEDEEDEWCQENYPEVRRTPLLIQNDPHPITAAVAS